MKRVDLVPHPLAVKGVDPLLRVLAGPGGVRYGGGGLRMEVSLTPVTSRGLGRPPHHHPLGMGMGGTRPSPGTALGW